jgi:hypothetical protein
MHFIIVECHLMVDNSAIIQLYMTIKCTLIITIMCWLIIDGSFNLTRVSFPLNLITKFMTIISLRDMLACRS